MERGELHTPDCGRRGELYTPCRRGELYTPDAAGKEKDQNKKDGVDGGVGV